MRRHIVPMTALIAIMLLGMCISASAQGVRFVTPEDGDTVRDMVRLQATKPSPDEGWISYKISQDDDGDFVAAVTPPFSYLWNTRARDDEGNYLYDDGQYTITAVALNPSGEKINEAEITVTVRNEVEAVDAPEEVQLRLFYDRNVEVKYRAEGSWTMTPASDEEDPEDVWELARQFDGALVSNWKNRAMSPTYAAGHAILYVIVGSSGAQVGDGEVQVLERAGDRITYRALRDGEMRRRHSDDPEFELAELTVPIPDRPLRQGDSWEGRIKIWPDPLKGTATAAAPGMGMEDDMWMDDPYGMPHEMHPEGYGMMEEDVGMAPRAEATAPTRFETTTVRAQHTLEGFEWVSGYRTARIRSTYNVDEDKITIPVSGAPGMAGAEMDEFGDDMYYDEMMPGMGPPGFEDDMGMGPGTGAATPEQDTSYTGERITYWSWELQRPIRIVDMVTHTLEIPRPQVAQMGMEYGDEPGMYYEDPMDYMPPEERYDPRQRGRRDMDEYDAPPRWRDDMYDYPGMGPGMAAPEPVEPMKVRVRVQLNIQEVGL